MTGDATAEALRKPQASRHMPQAGGRKPQVEFLVAIDGTAGSGKSTTAKLAARELGFFHLDTGAMYRAITLKAVRSRTDPADTAGLERMLAGTRVELKPANGDNQVLLDGKDVTQEVRSPEVDREVSQVSAVPIVRAHLVTEQRRLARGRQVVCEGRDIASVVFPDADLKFFIDADVHARAIRRRGELKEKGVELSDRSVRDNLTERDYIDSTRAVSPLTRVPEAIVIDTTNLTVEEEVMIVVNIARMRMARMGNQPLTPNP